MRPVSYSTPTLTSLIENFPGISVTDATQNAFSGYEAPDAYNTLNPWRGEKHDHYHASQAFGLSNPVIRSTLTGQIATRSENSWYMGVVMPLVVINSNRVSVNTTRFEETMAPVTPAEGIPTITEVTRDETSFTITRRAKAIIMEHEFMKTEMGKQHYIANLKHLTTIAFEVMCYDVIHALINAKNAAMEWELKYGFYTSKSEEEILGREKEFWCALQKQEFGMQKLDTRIVQMTSKYGIFDLDTYILPVEPKDWLAVTPSENNTYSKGGPDAVDNITNNIGNAIDGKRPLGRLLGGRYQVFLTRTYCTQSSGVQENLMMRERHIGEFNKMLPLHEENGADYKSFHRTIKIYDENEDMFKDITLHAALDASAVLFTDDGINNNFKRNRPENFDDDMKDNFLFKQRRYGDGVEPITYFGQMKEKHLSTRTIIEWGKSAVASLAKDSGVTHDGLSGSIAENIE
jgi:hypothetical protein